MSNSEDIQNYGLTSPQCSDGYEPTNIGLINNTYILNRADNYGAIISLIITCLLLHLQLIWFNYKEKIICLIQLSISFFHIHYYSYLIIAFIYNITGSQQKQIQVFQIYVVWWYDFLLILLNAMIGFIAYYRYRTIGNQNQCQIYILKAVVFGVTFTIQVLNIVAAGMHYCEGISQILSISNIVYTFVSLIVGIQISYIYWLDRKSLVKTQPRVSFKLKLLIFIIFLTQLFRSIYLVLTFIYAEQIFKLRTNAEITDDLSKYVTRYLILKNDDPSYSWFFIRLVYLLVGSFAPRFAITYIFKRNTNPNT